MKMPRALVNAFGVGVLAASAVAAGVWGVGLWKYDGTPGAAALPPEQWPANSRVARQAGLPTLVLLAHPKCPCTRATVGELARLMTVCQGKVRTTVMVTLPAGTAAGWEKTDLWNSAAEIPGVTVATDEAGREARLFGASTSGQALLYSAEGKLLFAGGITESRGHSGDNAGESALIELIQGRDTPATGAAAQAPVYGCSLFDRSSATQEEGCTACRK